MTLHAHFVRSDLRHFRWSIAAWVIVAAAGMGLEVAAAAFASSEYQARAISMAVSLLTVRNI